MSELRIVHEPGDECSFDDCAKLAAIVWAHIFGLDDEPEREPEDDEGEAA
jgi:hypothetical protein